MTRPSSSVVVVHYNEIALKLGHRSMFVGRLLENVRAALAGLPVGPSRVVTGRLIVETGHAQAEQVLCRLALLPGVANVLLARCCEPRMDALEALVDELLGAWHPQGSFRVEAKRADKCFPLTSPQIGAQIGARIRERTGAPVDLSSPESIVYVEVLPKAIYLAIERRNGCGGLPVPTGGRILLLLSGGIDSPVAGLRMMRRGCRVDAIHFHSVPYLDKTSQDKARRLCCVLARGQGSTRLTMVAFGEAQREIVRSVPAPLRVVLYRRMMMRIASRVARADRLKALATGESLGQVASQTLANLSVIEQAASLPVLRPLLGMDKLEITRYARNEGTYEISIVPDQDCCTLFVPKHPATAARSSEVEEAERGLDMEEITTMAVEGRCRERVGPDWAVDPSAMAAYL